MIPAVFLLRFALMPSFAWCLLHFVWQGAFFAGALLATLRMTRGQSARLRYGISCGVLAAMALCPLLTCARLALQPPTVNPAEHAVLSASTRSNESPAAFTPAAKHMQSFIRRIDRHSGEVMLLWSLGTFLAMGRVFVSAAAVRRLRRSSVRCPSAENGAATPRLAFQLGLAFTPSILIVSEVSSPVVAGWVRPAVLLPPSALDLPSEQAEAILAHEFAHIRRRDPLANLLQAITEALLFYHPAVWWVSRQIRREREHCCDDIALDRTSPLMYAKALLAIEERRSLAGPQLSLSASGGDLSMRIQRLLSPNQTKCMPYPKQLSLVTFGATVAGALFIMTLAATGQVLAQTQKSDAPQAELQRVSPEKRQSHPDLSCTFYDTAGLTHTGLCQASAQDSSKYLCRQTDGERLTQLQSGCEWKVKRLQQWERAQSHR